MRRQSRQKKWKIQPSKFTRLGIKNKKEEKATEKKPAVTEPKKTEKKEAPKKKSNELEGQMDLFSMMGL